MKTTSQSTSPIDKHNYADRARAYIAKHDNQGAVIRSPSRQWDAWMAYLDRIGYGHRYADKRQEYTVPAAWPAMFDPTAGALGLKTGGDPGRFDLGEAR